MECQKSSSKKEKKKAFKEKFRWVYKLTLMLDELFKQKVPGELPS